ncbi:MAG: hypothetical protein MJZ46_03200 [Bacteroidales bacterium]|nr:hypothetical protein [Bacteroidales bacterium]
MRRKVLTQQHSRGIAAEIVTYRKFRPSPIPCLTAAPHTRFYLIMLRCRPCVDMTRRHFDVSDVWRKHRNPNKSKQDNSEKNDPREGAARGEKQIY